MEPTKQLKSDEIIEFIQKLGSRIDKTTLDQCDPDTIVELYASLLERLGILKKKHLNIEFEAMPLFAYNNLHNRPIYIFKLYHFMKDFIQTTLGIEDFPTSDLFAPTPKKTRKILLGIIKFFKFKAAEKEFYTLAKETSASSELELLQAKEALKKAEETLRQLRLEKDNEKEEGDRISAEIAKVKKEESEVLAKVSIATEECNKLNDVMKEYDAKIEMVDKVQAAYLNSIRSMRNQIVNSPGKMQTVINETLSQIDVLNKEISEKETACLQFEKHLGNLELLGLSLKEYSSTVADLDRAKLCSEELNAKMKEMKETIELKHKTLEDTELKISNVQTQIDNYQLYIDDHHQKNMEAKGAKESELGQLKAQLDELNEKISGLDERLGMSQGNIKAYEDNLQELAVLKSDYEKHIEDEMDSIEASVKEYVENFEKMLEPKQ